MGRKLLEAMLKTLEKRFEEKGEADIVTSFFNESIGLQYTNKMTIFDIQEKENKLEMDTTHGLTITIGLNCKISYEEEDTYFFRYENGTLAIISII